MPKTLFNNKEFQAKVTKTRVERFGTKIIAECGKQRLEFESIRAAKRHFGSNIVDYIDDSRTYKGWFIYHVGECHISKRPIVGINEDGKEKEWDTIVNCAKYLCVTTDWVKRCIRQERMCSGWALQYKEVFENTIE